MPELLSSQQTQELDGRYDGWLTTEEAAARIGVSARTIRTWISNGTLRKLKRPLAGSPPIVIVHPEDVEREAAARHAPVPMPGDVAHKLQPAQPEPIDKYVHLLRTYDAITKARTPAPPPLNLELEAASAFSGLPKRLLLQAIQDGQLRAHRWARKFYINVQDLSEFRPNAEPKLNWTGASLNGK